MRVRRIVLALSLLVLAAAPAPVGASPPAGFTTFVAGGSHGDGLPATRGTLRLPRGIALGPDGVYVSDFFHHQVRVIGPDGVIDRAAGSYEGFSGDGGPAQAAQLNRPQGLAFDAQGNMFITDAGNHRIRRVDRQTGVITTVAGNGDRAYAGDGGPANQASLAFPHDVAFAPDGSLYIADYENFRVRRVSPNGTISTFAGNGIGASAVDGVPATASPLDAPSGVAVDASGAVYIADEGNCSIRRVAGGTITRVAGGNGCGFSGDGGPATAAQLAFPGGVEVDGQGQIWVSDTNNLRVRVVGTDGVIRTVAGNGTDSCPAAAGAGTAAGLVLPFAATVAPDATAYFVTEGGSSNGPCQRAWRLAPDGTLSPFAGTSVLNAGQPGDPATSVTFTGVQAVAYDEGRRPFFADAYGVWTLDEQRRALRVAGAGASGDKDGPADEARFGKITDIAFGKDGALWIADEGMGKVKRLEGGVVETMAGTGIQDDPKSPDGPALETKLWSPHGVAVAPDGAVYFTETGSSGRIRVLANGAIRTLNAGSGFAGDGSPVSAARFYQPRGLAFAPDGGLLVADYGNNRIRRIGPDGIVSTAAGDGGLPPRGDGTLASLASFSHPDDVEAGPAGDLFVAESYDQVIRHIAPNGMVSRLAGTASRGENTEGPALETPLFLPRGVALGPDGLLVADSSSVRLVTPSPGGWPRPPRTVSCDPPVQDVMGDGGPRLAGGIRGPNRPWLDVVAGHLRTEGSNLTATIRVQDLSEAGYGPPVAAIGDANLWLYVIRINPTSYRYLAAVAPASVAGGATPPLLQYEHGVATVNGFESWALSRTGAAAGTFDTASDTVTITAPLAVLGLATGDLIGYQETDGATLFEFGIGRSGIVDDQGPNGGTTRSYRVGSNCPESY